MKKTAILLFTILLFHSCSDDETLQICGETALFQEVDGLLVIESESVPLAQGWALRTDLEGFTGNGYIFWDDQDYFGQPGNGLMTYEIAISTPGTYRFQWRTRIVGEDNTEGNDAWLRFPDADDFFGRKNNSDNVVYPGGSGKSPNPNGQSKEGWFKIYQNQLNEWSTRANTSDHDAHNVFVTFDSAGSYTMELSGRSAHFAIDRIMLYLEEIDADVATDPETRISEVACE
ncbi:MAG: hypothetical protein AAGA85_13130 [Bacteroidota bacterium]